MSRYTRDYGKSSSWYAKGWAPSTNTIPVGARGPLVVIIAMSGTKMHREVRLRPGGYSPRPGPMLRSRSWMSETEARVRPPRTMPRTEKAADATGSSTGDAATDKEAAKRRLSELHRLLNSRKGSLNATYRKNAEDKAYDLNQKSVQALDALAKEYVDFEVTGGRRCTACSDSGSGRRGRTSLERARPSAGRSGQLE